jgi:hypothetical protein
MDVDIPLISLIASIMSRLSYFDNRHFLHKYIQIFNIRELHQQLSAIKEVDMKELFNVYISNRVLIHKKINLINYNKDSEPDTEPISSKDVQYISISTSNYSSVYIVANKLMNTIFVCFRGTYSVKSGLSYLKLSSISPRPICDDSEDGYLLGVFKIISEIFFSIEESIHYLCTHFLKTTIPQMKLIATGHSLGGGAASIFSYLWVKHQQKNKKKNIIACITFGSPRVMNGPLIKKFNKLIHANIILFKRYINNGDPFVNLPISSKQFENSYYFPDEYDASLNVVAIMCSDSNRDYKKTKKICKLKSKTKKRKSNMKHHGLYLGISYKGAANNLLDLNKEIYRNENRDTICRIIIGGNNEKMKVVFFNLEQAKKKNQGTIRSKLGKLKKTFFQMDYVHQDIYINTKMFETLIKYSSELELDNDNYTRDTLVKIQETNPKKELNCFV